MKQKKQKKQEQEVAKYFNPNDDGKGILNMFTEKELEVFGLEDVIKTKKKRNKQTIIKEKNITIKIIKTQLKFLETIKIATYNIRGNKYSDKRKEIEEWMQRKACATQRISRKRGKTPCNGTVGRQKQGTKACFQQRKNCQRKPQFQHRTNKL
jgi:hypothetical protein